MRILVTGGCGFIGSEFVNYVYENHKKYQLVVVDKLTYAAYKNSIPSDVLLIEKDICDVTIGDTGHFDFLVNFAAESHVDNSIKDGTPFVKTNLQGTFNLLELTKKSIIFKKFVQISTDEVYGDLDLIGKYHSTEDDRLIPSSYYSATKAGADELVIAATHTFGIPSLITRTCNNYGSHQHKEKFLPTIIESIKNDKPIPVYGDGKQIREWVWVRDNVKVIFDLMIRDYGIWNIGSSDVYRNIDIINMIGEILNKDVKFEYVEDRLGHDRKYTLNSEKLRYKYGREKYITKSLKQYLKEQLL